MLYSKGATTFTTMLERDRNMEFLADLDSEYDQVSIQILGTKKLHYWRISNDIYHIVRCTGFKILWRTYCKKAKHTKDTCFKLHYKEAALSCIGGFSNLQSRNQANLTTKEPNKSPEKVELLYSNLVRMKSLSWDSIRSLLYSMDRYMSHFWILMHPKLLIVAHWFSCQRPYATRFYLFWDI